MKITFCILFLVFTLSSCTYDEVKKIQEGTGTSSISFSTEIAPLFTTAIDGNSKTCMTCHGGGNASGGFSIGNAEVSYDSVKSKVVAGDAAGSVLYQKLSGVGMTSGVQMPKGGPNYLSEANLSKVKTWIDEGASNTTVSFATDISPLFSTAISGNSKTCVTCHDASGASGGFSIGSGSIAYDNVAAKVTAGDATNSVLYQKLSGTGITSGVQMPKGGPNYYSESNLNKVKDWINQGAKNN